MHLCSVFAAFVISAASLHAQDPGQQAMQATMQANIDAMSSNQGLPAPTFSRKSGAYPGSFLLGLGSALQHGGCADDGN